MKVLLDQNVPRPIVRFLRVHGVTRAVELGWSELKNGALLSAAERAVVKDHVAAIVDAIDKALPGTVTGVDCGAFVPRRFLKPSGSFP